MKSKFGNVLLATLFLLSVSFLWGKGGDTKWETSIQKGFQTAKLEKKFLIVDLYADWCTYCLVLEKEIFPDPELSKVLDGFVRVRLDGDEFPNLKNKYKVEGYPTILFLDADANYLTKITGLATKEDILRISKQILEEPNFESYLKTELRRTNGSPELLFRLGIFYHELKKWELAREYYRKVSEHKKADPKLKDLTTANLKILDSQIKDVN